MLHVTVEESGDSAILHCVGRIVRGHETTLLCPAARQRKPNVVLDLSEVDTIDAAGIGALVSLQAAGIYLRLMNPSSPVREVLHATRLDAVFEIVNSRPASETVGDGVRGTDSGVTPFHPRSQAPG
jgi:anti-anti-sigma factor